MLWLVLPQNASVAFVISCFLCGFMVIFIASNKNRKNAVQNWSVGLFCIYLEEKESDFKFYMVWNGIAILDSNMKARK